MTNPEKLRALAGWLDLIDKEAGCESNEVQQDLRAIADELEKLSREKYIHFIGRRYPTPYFPKGGIEAMGNSRQDSRDSLIEWIMAFKENRKPNLWNKYETLDELAEAFWPSKPKQ